MWAAFGCARLPFISKPLCRQMGFKIARHHLAKDVSCYAGNSPTTQAVERRQSKRTSEKDRLAWEYGQNTDNLSR